MRTRIWAVDADRNTDQEEYISTKFERAELDFVLCALDKTFEGANSRDIHTYRGEVISFLTFLFFHSIDFCISFCRRRPSQIIHTCFEGVKGFISLSRIWIGWRRTFWSKYGEERLIWSFVPTQRQYWVLEIKVLGYATPFSPLTDSKFYHVVRELG